ncbi:uncharacterized protein LOC115768824 [Drosophila novamexicana]|uniref:uncharacterized protein LOC115768824 n=1 Tax=Drosophila novamexicana TaxID=47314 RepID=UPI0011E6017A|nr:uncharacterized protein LOC115768824 [Drosophila novamexicana]
MRSMAAWLLMTLLASTAAAAEQLSTELDDYATAGSEDIYLQPNSGQAADEEDDEDAQYLDEEEEEEAPAQSLGNNIDAIGLDENSCEFSCPRYYRPVCVSRNDELITYATPCEFFNQLRCANVARQRGKETPTFQLLYHNACKQNTR